MPVTFAVRGPVALPSSSGPVAGAEAAAFLARAGTLNDAHRDAYINLINGLVTDTVWPLLDVLQIYAAANSTVALLNLKDTTCTASTAGGTLAFAPDLGFTPVAGGDVVQTNFIPSAGINYTLNAASMGIWLVTAVASATATVGANADCEMYVPYTDTNIYTRLNDSTYAGSTGGQTGVGFTLAVRTAASGAGSRTSYINGGSLSSGSATSTSLAGTSVVFGNVLGIQTAAFVAGGNIDALWNSLFTRMRAYMTAVGVP